MAGHVARTHGRRHGPQKWLDVDDPEAGRVFHATNVRRISELFARVPLLFFGELELLVGNPFITAPN
jgi:hypothetical protein